MLKQGLEDETAVMKKQLSEATLSRSTAEEELHGAEAALAAEGKQLAADEKYLAELKQSCSAKAGRGLRSSSFFVLRSFVFWAGVPWGPQARRRTNTSA